MRQRHPARRTGFTLIEVALVMAVIAVLTAAVAPVAIRTVETRFAERTAREVSQIQDAAKWYFVDTKAWPASVDVLKAGGYLNPNWSGVTPFGQAYSVSSTPTAFTVSVPVPAGLEGVLTQVVTVPSTIAAGANVVVTSTVPAPGREASLTQFIQRTGDRMSGPLILDDTTVGFASGGTTRFAAGLAGGNFAVLDGGGTQRLGIDTGTGRTTVTAITGGAADFGPLTASTGDFSGQLRGTAVTGTTASFPTGTITNLTSSAANLGTLAAASGSFSGNVSANDLFGGAVQRFFSESCFQCT